MWYNLDSGRKTQIPKPNAYISETLKVYSFDLDKLTHYIASKGYDQNDICHNKFGYIENKREFIPQAVLDMEEKKDMYFGYYTSANVIRIIDGDTVVLGIYVDLDTLGKLGNIVSYGGGYATTVKCRLLGIDTKEKNEDLGVKSKEYLNTVCTKLSMHVNVLFHIQDKYGRYLVELFDKHNQSINQMMLDNNTLLCQPYYGGKKE